MAPYRPRMRFAVNLPPFADAHEVLDLMLSVEEHGWDGVFLWDHLQWRADHPVHDPWALLSAAAVRTERVMLGTCVTPLSRRRPFGLAKQVATLDHLSRGRVMLGVGLGEPPDADFADLGDEDDPRIRATILDEALAVVDPLLRGERVDHDGEHFTIHGRARPASVQDPRPPIFVAGVAPNRRPLERARRWDGFFPISPDGPLSPQLLADYVGDAERPDGWDLFVGPTEEYDPADYGAVGATWIVEGTWPVGDWMAELTARVADGPPR